MSGWDDKTPNAYEESWALATVDTTTTGTNDEVVMINGRAGDNLWRYDLTQSGVRCTPLYIQANSAGEADHGDVKVTLTSVFKLHQRWLKV